MPRHSTENHGVSRRTILKGLGFAPLLLRPSPLHGYSLLFGDVLHHQDPPFPFSDIRLTPHYPAKSPLEDVLRLIAPGADEFVTEKYAYEIGSLLEQWSAAIRRSARGISEIAKFLNASIEGSSFGDPTETTLRTGGGIEIVRRHFPNEIVHGSERFIEGIRTWLGPVSRIDVAEFEITSIEEIASAPLAVRLEIRYDIVAQRTGQERDERVGTWGTEWRRDGTAEWKAAKWQAREETLSRINGPVFIDVTSQALGGVDSYKNQMLRGSDYWRTVLDGACGIDVYGTNGVAAGDFDNDGLDDLYVCQPAGLPNRLYRNRGDGTFEDVTEKSGVGVLDNTACALFADFQNRGFQDLLVVCGGGPLLFLNQGDGTFAIKRDAFQFAHPPEGTFTHAAIADYDGDGRLDIYFCLYSYYLGLDQYHYPVPYFDARNGPANFLLHNEGNAVFVDRTAAAGLNAENDRYSFACAWGESGSSGFPDLYVANDFGRGNLYRNNGDGTFSAISGTAHVDDAGAGMSACWSDCDNDGKQDIYAANMWSAAGQRVSDQKLFHEKAPEDIRALYRRHARGNSLYRNKGNGQFDNVSGQVGVEMGRWSWCSDFWDFDHDGYPDLYVANGYISAPERNDLASFFWRQVVGNSPDDATPAQAYERGWQAINELIRSDRSWNGYERNVMFANNRDGTFSEVSGVVGLDFPEDGRSFVLADIDHDGRLEVILKNRNAPQLRIMHNAMKDIGHSIAFRLRGKKSNRDAIGAAVVVESGALRQTKYLQAGSGFLAQHSKEIFFGLGKEEGTVRAMIRWPSGLSQEWNALPINRRIEIEEGSDTFSATAFAAPPSAYAQPAQPTVPEQLPSRVATWLMEPLKAPEFTLPDLSGNTRSLQEFRDHFVLLIFWAKTAPISSEQLKLLDRGRLSLAGSGVKVVAINVDSAANDAGDAREARSAAGLEALSFPVLFATEDVAGIYNIVYRYLFDRRRNLAIPTAFLVDREGMIVKVYQGALELADLLKDVRSVPATATERMRRALPFAGTAYLNEFVRNDFTYGVAMLQHGYLDEAAASFQQVVAAKPNNPEGYYNLGTLSLQRHDYSQARQYLEEALKLRPNYPEAWNNLGMMAAQEGHMDEAVQNFRQSLLLRPAYATALLNLGNVYRRHGDSEKAQDCLTRALELQPDDPEANYSLGMFYAQQNQLTRAEQYLQKAAELRPDYPEALNNLGVLYVREQDYARAEAQFKSCIRMSPKFDQSYLNLARLYVMQNDKEKAREALEDLLRVQPDNPNAKQAIDVLNALP